MNESASVHSLEALHDWHAALCVFRTEALEALASVNLEIQRADAWLDDQLRHWQQVARDRENDVVRYRAELSNRKFVDYSGRMPDCSVQEENLWEAERKLEYARDQIDVVRAWFHRLPKMINEEYQAPARHLTNFLEGDLPRSIAALNRQIISLEAYLNIRPESAPAAPAAAAPTPKAPS